MSASIVAQFNCATGECPRWHTDERRLYWTDIPSGRLYYFDHRTGESCCCYEGRPVGGFTIQADGSLLLFRDQGNVVVFKHGEKERTIVSHIPGLETTRFNDVTADPEGRVFAGTMSFGGQNNGKLLRIDCDGKHALISDGHATPNGMGFTPDLSQLYFTDSRLRRIYLLEFNRSTGELSNPKIWQEIAATDVPLVGRSDGMAVASDGSVWSARMEAGVVIRYSPAGVALERHEIGTPMVTSVTFGGPELDEVYVTSAGGKASQPISETAGALFKIRADARGRAEFRSRVGL
ncbi:MAG: SMP-30/gluconolactonase/LRE family protein [Polyangiaceae bacterium]|nr:SMP-30/gluconolactonase/LRE family protein [Polyangiaceae bacterium]